jgi:predicted dehydrogenase
MTKINVAVVGCGYVANDHLKAWRRLREANVVAVSDLNENLAKSKAKTWNIPKYYSTLSDLLANCKVDVVDICTPPQTHTALAVEAMKAGVNVLIEKPMTMTVKDAGKIVECQKATVVKAGVIHNWLFDSPVLQADSMIKKGKLGEILHVEIEALNTKYDSMVANEHHWCHIMPGGRFSEMLAHPIYLVRHFLNGEVEVDDIQISKVGNYPWMKSDELCAIFRVGKKLGRLYCSFNSSRDAVYINLYGTEGIIKMDLINAILMFLPKRRTSRFSKGFDSLRQAGQIVKCTAKNTAKIVSRGWMSGHDLCIKLFAESLISSYDPPVSVTEGLAVVKTLEEMCNRINELDGNA